MLGAEAQLLLVDWRALREPFVLPLGLHHCAFEDWESIDCDLAACAICGASHACDAATCPFGTALISAKLALWPSALTDWTT